VQKSKDFSNGLKNPTDKASRIRWVLLSAGEFLFGCGPGPAQGFGRAGSSALGSFTKKKLCGNFASLRLCVRFCFLVPACPGCTN
jgi:hypothetical protein